MEKHTTEYFPLKIMKERGITKKYDKEEDRANDVKKHDNPNHSGKVANDKVLEEAKAKQNEQQN